MSMQDPIADMLTRIRNAQSAKHDRVSIPYSKIKANILSVLDNEGYIRSVREIGDSTQPSKRQLEVALKYYNGGESVISKIKRESKPGLRKYCAKDNLPNVLGGLGIAIMSTSKGVVSARQALKMGLGGEVLALVE